MAAPSCSLWVLALTCVILGFVGSSLGSLKLTIEIFNDKNFCGNLKCWIKDSSKEGFFVITSLTLYNTSQSDVQYQIANVKNDGNGIKINQSKNSEVVGAGCINRYDADLSVSLMNPHDCHFGKFLCELTYIDTDGHSDIMIADVNADNATNDFNYGALSSQLSRLSRQLDNTTRQLNTLVQNYTVELKAMNQYDFILYTQFQNVSHELTLLKDQQISIQTALTAITKNEQLNQTYPRINCTKGMSHNSTHVKFLLWGQIPALCDTETDGGGWVIIQRRTKGDVSFYKNWQSYKTGFGTPDTDFWLGNEVIHNLTLRGYNELRMDITYNNEQHYAQYNIFSVDNEQQNYRLSVSGYRGTSGDGLAKHNNMMFSTYDRDNDKHSLNCAMTCKGAWWYNKCYASNLNGVWGANDGSGVEFNPLGGILNFTELKVRLGNI